MRKNWMILGSLSVLMLIGAGTPAMGLDGSTATPGVVRADFDGDGFADLAVGIPGEDLGSVADAGAVNVIYGSSLGLTAVRNQLWTQDSPGIEDLAEAVGERFGAALAAADFGNGSQADLAIGVPGEDQRTGAVNLVYGSATGLSASGNQFWTPEVLGISFGAEEPASFGWALAAANLGNGSQADLAVGTPALAGEVNVIYGTTAGLTSAGNQLWTQDSPGILGTAESDPTTFTGDEFGTALAAANFGNGSEADLAVGVPGEDVGTIVDAGAVNVLYGAASGLTATGNQLWHQNSSGIAGTAEPSDRFGEAVAAH